MTFPDNNENSGADLQADLSWRAPTVEEGSESLPPQKVLPWRRYAGPVLAGVGVVAFVALLWNIYTATNLPKTPAEAPLVQADAAPTKIRPEQPGGMEIPHQDRLIFDRLAGGTGERGGVEHLLPPAEEPLPRPAAPEQPVAAPVADAAAVAAPVPTPAPASEPVPSPSSAPTPAPAPVAAASDMAGKVPMEVVPVPQSFKMIEAEASDPASTAPSSAVEKPAAAPSAPAITLPSLAGKTTTPAATPSVGAKPAAAPAQRVVGNGKIQLASMRSETEARGEWARLQRKYPAQLGGLTMTLMRVDLPSKGTFYRVQAGPVDGVRAETICNALRAQSVGCLILR